ncbi:MAG: DUF4230 domain-containing protein [Bacilli bacterium]|nr:DUF4230 domain-containing protein [Bacilli bacterium]
MKSKDLKQETIEIKVGSEKKIKFPIVAIIIFALIIVFGGSILTSREGKTKNTVKSSLDKVVEKSDLESVSFTYNVIAKKCKDDKNCDLKSNDIDDFKYVVSCKGTITAGIDFQNVKIDVDENKKVITVQIPEATLSKTPSVGSVKFLNEDVSADELPNARNLCAETIKNKSEDDEKLLPAAKEQARVVLEEFYSQWIKAYNQEYKVEVK